MTEVHRPTSLHRRVRRGARHRENWDQLVRFSLVGGSGYVVNLATFTAVVHGLGAPYQVGSVVAFLVSVTGNFLLNRHWTFVASDGHAGKQAVRFLTLSVGVYLFTFVMLTALIEIGHAPEVLAQAVAVCVAMPISFVGNRLWSFSTRT